ncbi:MAG: XrtA/PEP-CTERM system exopolysaccharide export protein [Sulfuricaulis sp.]
MNSFRNFFTVLLVGIAVLMSGCASSRDAMEAKAKESNQMASYAEGGAYRIGVDDRLQVTVWRNPDLSVVSEPVRPDGKISVPLIGDVQAGGNTPTQVAAIIKEKLSAYIREPNVTVILTDLRSHEFLSRVRITGAVRTPRSMPFRQGMTVLDAVLEAGGINDFASPNGTKLYRRSKTKTEVLDIDLGDILTKGKLATNYELDPGDVVTVPERLF